MVGPAAKREAVAHLQAVMGLSERRACSFVRADRKMIRYRSCRPPETELRGRLRDLANERRRFGYRRLFVLLRREGEPSGINRIYRLYRDEGLTVRKRRARRRAVGTRAPILVEARPNARWSLDFVHDQFACGRRFRVLNIVDDVTRECLAAIPDTSISRSPRCGRPWDDQAELAQVGADRIGELRQLADKKVARPMAHQHRLLDFGLDRNEAHRRLGQGRADRLGVRGISLPALDEGLDIRRRDQPHLVAELRQLPRPVVRPRAGFDAGQTRAQAREEQQQLCAPQLPPDDNRPGGVDRVDLKHVLGQIQPDSSNLLPWMAPFMGSCDSTQCGTVRCREREPSTPSTALGPSPSTIAIRPSLRITRCSSSAATTTASSASIRSSSPDRNRPSVEASGTP